MDVHAKLPPLIQRTYVINVMAMVQMLQSGGASNFSEQAARHNNLIVATLGQNGCIPVDVVFDRYTPKLGHAWLHRCWHRANAGNRRYVIQ